MQIEKKTLSMNLRMWKENCIAFWTTLKRETRRCSLLNTTTFIINSTNLIRWLRYIKPSIWYLKEINSSVVANCKLLWLVFIQRWYKVLWDTLESFFEPNRKSIITAIEIVTYLSQKPLCMCKPLNKGISKYNQF